MHPFIQFRLITRPVVGQYGEVDALGGLLRMEFPVVPVLVLALVVIDAEGDIGSLLDLSNKTAGTDGMDTTCGNEEHITLMSLITSQSISDGVVIHHLLVLLRCDLFLQTIVDDCSWFRFQTIPHLRLATWFAQTRCCLIVRMYLDREVLTSIDKLNEQRELITETLVVFLADQHVLLFAHQLVQTLTFILAVGNDSLTVLDT